MVRILQGNKTNRWDTYADRQRCIYMYVCVHTHTCTHTIHNLTKLWRLASSISPGRASRLESQKKADAAVQIQRLSAGRISSCLRWSGFCSIQAFGRLGKCPHYGGQSATFKVRQFKHYAHLKPLIETSRITCGHISGHCGSAKRTQNRNHCSL